MLIICAVNPILCYTLNNGWTCTIRCTDVDTHTFIANRIALKRITKWSNRKYYHIIKQNFSNALCLRKQKHTHRRIEHSNFLHVYFIYNILFVDCSNIYIVPLEMSFNFYFNEFSSRKKRETLFPYK